MVEVVLYGGESIFHGPGGVFGGLFLRRAADVHVHRHAVADAADKRVDRKVRGLSGDVPETVIKCASPARISVNPPRPRVEFLVQLLSCQGVFPHHQNAQLIQRISVHPTGNTLSDCAYARDPIVGLHVHNLCETWAGGGMIRGSTADVAFRESCQARIRAWRPGSQGSKVLPL